uniref:Uncharacterized protein n=1 Tax=viral metagenome TaxID=1070528 RepID=A0A6C0KIP7_9ZZZZ
MNNFIISYYLSLCVQFITFLIQFYGIFLYVSPLFISLKYALHIELWVSLIEFMVYLWIGTNLKNLDKIMTKRYIDWVLTTNALMVSLSLLFIFFKKREEKSKNTSSPYAIAESSNDNIKQIISNNKKYIIPLIIFNNAMLLFGFMGEKKIIPKFYSFTIGFLFFILNFYFLFEYFAKHSSSGKVVFYIITFIWSMYGFSHILSNMNKNICYNILDLISKNIFGLFMVYLIFNPESFMF